MSTNIETKQKVRPQDLQFLGHPVGLWVLFTTEMWERFCYYGMRAFLVMYLYFSINSSNPGFGWSEKEAYELYGWFTGLVYLLPLFGGFIADRFIGQHRSVLYGGILIAAGEFCLFFTEYFRQSATSAVTLQSCPSAWLAFMGGLALITIGTGFFKPCISVMVGQLYKQNDTRRDVAFTIFYMGINVGALMAPLVAGTVAEKIGWHWGFLTAAIGMIFGLITYSSFRPRYLGHIGMIDSPSLEDEEKAADSGTASVENAVTESATDQRPKEPEKALLSRREIDRVAVILVLSFFCIAFWSVFEQAGSSLNTFAKKETNRRIPQWMAGSEKHPFMENEDEEDAQASLFAARLDMAEAAERMEQVSASVSPARDLLLKEGKNSPDLIKLVSQYDQASRNVQEKLTLANWAKNRADHARSIASLKPSEVVIPGLPQLLEQGKKLKQEMEAEVKRLCETEFTSLANQARSEGKNETQIEVDRQRFIEESKLSFIKDKKTAEEQERQKKLVKADTLFTFPATWYQIVNPVGIVCLAPLFALLWGFLARRNWEPSTPVKFGIALVLLSISFLLMVPGGIQAQSTGGNASAMWLLATYIFCTLGELCLSPVGLSMVSRLAPKQYASLLMGVWFLSSSVACYLSGKLAAVLGSSGADGEGRIYFLFGQKGGMADYFFLMAMIPLVASLLVFILAPMLRRMMHEEK